MKSTSGRVRTPYDLIDSQDFLHCVWLKYNTACSTHEINLTFGSKPNGHCLASTLRD